MSPWIKRIYDLAPASIQNALLSTFSRYLERQRYGGRFSEFRDLLEESQWWDTARIVEWQDTCLRAVVRHADQHVPYYRELFRHRGIDPVRFRGCEDLSRIPILTRETIKTRTNDLKSTCREDRATLTVGHTSGTTGSPLTMFYDKDMVAMNYAAMDRQYRWAGARLGRGGDRTAVVRGNVIVPLNQKAPPYWRYNSSLNQMVLSSFHLKPANLESYFEALRDFKPTVLDGYPSSLYVLAKILLNSGQRLRVRAAITSSETLYDFQRECIETAFECAVFDYYAAAERVAFATECDRHNGRHLCEEYGVTEIVDESGAATRAGCEGVMVGTTLHNRGMPLIRYRTSDRTTLKPFECPCGRALPLMEDVTTKAEDVLRLRDGRLIPPSVLTHPFKPLDTIEASQIVQTDLDRLLIRLIPRPGYGQKETQHLVREFKARLGDDMRIDIELVESLPRTSRGKFKWVTSLVELGL